MVFSNFLFEKDKTQILQKVMTCLYHLLRSVARLLIFRIFITKKKKKKKKLFNTVLTLKANFLYYYPCGFNNVVFP